MIDSTRSWSFNTPANILTTVTSCYSTDDNLGVFTLNRASIPPLELLLVGYLCPIYCPSLTLVNTPFNAKISSSFLSHHPIIIWLKKDSARTTHALFNLFKLMFIVEGLARYKIYNPFLDSLGLLMLDNTIILLVS